jgi:hypothetical protein
MVYCGTTDDSRATSAMLSTPMCLCLDRKEAAVISGARVRRVSGGRDAAWMGVRRGLPRVGIRRGPVDCDELRGELVAHFGWRTRW